VTELEVYLAQFLDLNGYILTSQRVLFANLNLVHSLVKVRLISKQVGPSCVGLMHLFLG